MSSKQSMETKKLPLNKRRCGMNSKLSAEDLSRKILLFCIENLIPLDKVDGLNFKSFIATLISSEGSAQFLPDSNLLLHLADDIYDDYQSYFKSYFGKRSNIKMSITCHKWHPINEAYPYIFINCHYINDNFKLSELSLGLIKYSELSNFLVRDTILNNRLNFITTNCVFDEGISELLAFVSNQDTICQNMICCIPQFINDSLTDFFKEWSNLKGNPMDVNSLGFINNSRHWIPSMLRVFLDPIYTKFENLNLDELEPLPEDNENDNYNCITKSWILDQNACTLIFLKCLLFYKKPVSRLTPNNLTSEDWDLIEFVEKLSFRFYEVLLYCNDSNSDPVIHMVLKWLKVLILHVNSLLQGNLTIASVNIEPILHDLLKRLKRLHSDLEDKFQLILACYLHPSTKRYLKEQQIGKINSYVGSLSNQISPNPSSGKRDLDDCKADSIDDMIMKYFDCSGKATKECYNYETSATNEIHYSKKTEYLEKETGPHILQFWKENQDKYTNLSSLAIDNLSIQPSTDRSFHSFKTLFPEIQKVAMYRSQPLCKIQVIYFLHCLSKMYDISSFDPKNLDSDIEDYRLDPLYDSDKVDESFTSDSKESSFSIFEISRRLRR